MTLQEQFIEVCRAQRVQIDQMANAVKDLKTAPLLDTSLPLDPQVDRGEAIANIMLAFRHLEDAKMRLGKAIQAADGGVSVYDKDK